LTSACENRGKTEAIDGADAGGGSVPKMFEPVLRRECVRDRSGEVAGVLWTDIDCFSGGM